MPVNQTNFRKTRGNPPMEDLLKLAEKYSRRADEAEDLVQDLLLETVQTERKLSDQNYIAWAHGFLRNRAAFIARTEGRRRAREKKSQTIGNSQGYESLKFPAGFLGQLSPALQRVARLINCGLNKKEIIYLLTISDEALRQRFTALRKQWDLYTEENDIGPENKSESGWESPLDIGLLRRSLRKSFHGNPDKVIGSFDPDGNLLVFRSKTAHKKETGGNNRGEGKT